MPMFPSLADLVSHYKQHVLNEESGSKLVQPIGGSEEPKLVQPARGSEDPYVVMVKPSSERESI